MSDTCGRWIGEWTLTISSARPCRTHDVHLELNLGHRSHWLLVHFQQRSVPKHRESSWILDHISRQHNYHIYDLLSFGSLCIVDTDRLQSHRNIRLCQTDVSLSWIVNSNTANSVLRSSYELKAARRVSTKVLKTYMCVRSKCSQTWVILEGVNIMENHDYSVCIRPTTRRRASVTSCDACACRWRSQ